MNEDERFKLLNKIILNEKYGKFGKFDKIEIKFEDYLEFLNGYKQVIKTFNDRVIYSDTDSQIEIEMKCKYCNNKIVKCECNKDICPLCKGYIHKRYNVINEHYCHYDIKFDYSIAEPILKEKIFCKNCGEEIENCDEGRNNDCDKYKYFHTKTSKHECAIYYAEPKVIE